MRLFSFALMALLGGVVTANALTDDWRVKRPVEELDPPAPETRNVPLPTIVMGTGQIDGMHGKDAVFVKVVGGSVLDRGSAGNVERKISLQGWGGRRVRLLLRLKTMGDIHAIANAGITQGNAVLVGSQDQRVEANNTWRLYQFVRDVPADAHDFVIDLHLYGRGTLWIDDVSLGVTTDEVKVSSKVFPQYRRLDQGDTGPIRSPDDYGGVPNGVVNGIAGPRVN